MKGKIEEEAMKRGKGEAPAEVEASREHVEEGRKVHAREAQLEGEGEANLVEEDRVEDVEEVADGQEEKVQGHLQAAEAEEQENQEELEEEGRDHLYLIDRSRRIHVTHEYSLEV